ncbi:MAG: S9 family peptidase, partial [Phycisphaerae bacterium]|nr:S9 family peptidase [Phycisphaerae bacterium]
MKSFLCTVVVLMGLCSGACAVGLTYPATETVGHVDVYHGIEVADPYRWLEADVRESDRVAQWVAAENKVTFGYLEKLPDREAIEQRLTQLWDYAKFTAPFKVGGRYYIAKNDGLQNHYVYYVSETLDSEQRVLLNPNDWSKDGTVALGGLSFSDNGRYVAYGIQEAGSDWRTWKVRDIDTGQDLSDVLSYLKFTDVAWDPEAAGFFYAKYPDPDPNNQFQSLNQDMKVMYHRLGSAQSDDVVVYYQPEHPEWGYQIEVTDDGRYLILTIWVGTDPKYRVMVKDLQQEYAMPRDVITTFEHEFSFIDNDGPIFYFRTDARAPKGRIITIDLRRPEPSHWQEIIPESAALLEGANVVNNLLVCSYLKDVTTQVKLYTLKGEFVRDITLPGLGTASGFGGKRTYTETFYSFQSFAVPPSTYRYDMITGKSSLLEQAEVDFDPEQYVTEQVFYPSKDGTS